MRFKKTEDGSIGSVNINTCVRVTTEGNRQNTEVISSVVYTSEGDSDSAYLLGNRSRKSVQKQGNVVSCIIN